MYSSARSAARRSVSVAASEGSGTRPVTGTTIPGFVPHVTNGASVDASKSKMLSNSAPSSVGSLRQPSSAASQAAPRGAMPRVRDRGDARAHLARELAEESLQVEAARKHLHEEMLMGGATVKVPQADVVLVNPTHLSVALKYKPGQGAPRVVAKGSGTVALKIRELARTIDIVDASKQAANFTRNCVTQGIHLFDVNDPAQGIEHVVAPEIGLIRPGMVVLCGDSHTTTYGALGALGFGIGTLVDERQHCPLTRVELIGPAAHADTQ